MDGSVIPVLEQPIDLERGRVAECSVRTRKEQSGPELRIEIHLQTWHAQDPGVHADQPFCGNLALKPTRVNAC